MEGHLIGVTNMGECYTWRLIRNGTKKCTSYMWNITRNSNLNFIKNSSTPWHGAVDQDWRSKTHALNCTGPPECAQPVRQGFPLTLGSKPKPL